MKQPLPLLITLLLCWLAAAVLGVFSNAQANTVMLEHIFDGPQASLFGVLGYDDLGRSLLARVLSGARVSLTVAVSVTLLTCLTGVAIGTFAGWAGRWPDAVLSRITDIFLAFPGILLAIALAAMLGPGLENVIIALCVTGWVGFARLARAQVMSLKQREHILAARALGTADPVTLFRHVLPLMLAPLLVEASFSMAGAVVAEAGLSFLGLGVQAPQASWGGMLRDGVRYLLVAPHMTLVPALAVMAVVLSVNMLGDRLRDSLDVRQR